MLFLILVSSFFNINIPPGKSGFNRQRDKHNNNNESSPRFSFMWAQPGSMVSHSAEHLKLEFEHHILWAWAWDSRIVTILPGSQISGVRHPSLCEAEGSIRSAKELISRAGRTRGKWTQEEMQDLGWYWEFWGAEGRAQDHTSAGDKDRAPASSSSSSANKFY